MKTFKCKVLGVEFDLEKWQLEQLLKPEKVKLVMKVAKQGGKIELGISSVKPELLQQYGLN